MYMYGRCTLVMLNVASSSGYQLDGLDVNRCQGVKIFIAVLCSWVTVFSSL